MDIEKTRCCSKCRTPYNCGAKYHCDCHRRQVRESKGAKELQALRDAMYGKPE